MIVVVVVVVVILVLVVVIRVILVITIVVVVVEVVEVVIVVIVVIVIVMVKGALAPGTAAADLRNPGAVPRVRAGRPGPWQRRPPAIVNNCNNGNDDCYSNSNNNDSNDSSNDNRSSNSNRSPGPREGAQAAGQRGRLHHGARVAPLGGPAAGGVGRLL